MRLSGFGARARIDLARALTSRLPGTLAALAAGTISERHAGAVAEAVAPLTSPQAGEVEARVLARAGGQTVAELRRSVRREVLAVDDAQAGERAARVRRDRNCGTSTAGPTAPAPSPAPAGHTYHTEPHRYALPPPRPPAGDEPTSLEASARDEPQAPTAPDPPAAPPKPPPPYDDEPPF